MRKPMVRSVLSPNYSEGWPYGIPQAVMIHSTRSGRSDFTHAQELEATLRWFSNRDSQASAHWVVSPEEAVRVVADENRAWTAGQHNGYAHQIELTQPLTTTPYENGHYRLLSAVVEPYILEGVPILFVGDYTNGKKGFTGHEDSAHGRLNGKSDPGDLFDWARFIAMLREEDEMPDPQARAAIEVLIESANLQQGQIDFLAGIAVAHQNRLDSLDGGHYLTPEALEGFTKKLEAVESVAVANAKKLADAAEALS
jgi:hypothetical protein